MAHFAASGPAEERHLADRERREVVVEHEALVAVAVDGLDLLLVIGRAERCGDERLRLAAREHRRAVHTGQHSDLAPDAADLVELAAVEPDAVLEHLVAQHLLLELLEDGLRFHLALDLAFGERRNQLLENLVDAVVVLELAADAHRLAERDEHLLLDLTVELTRDFLLRHLALLLADLLRRDRR